MDITYYKTSIEQTVNKATKTYADALSKKGGNVTFRALPPSDVEHFSTFDLTKFNYQTDIPQYIEELTSALLSSIEKRRDVADNFIPNLSPILGIGDYSAFVVGDIYFQKDTSWSKPSLVNIDDYKQLPPLGSSVWYKKFMYICEEIIKVCAKTGIPFMRGFFSPLDLAAALRGEEIYYDFYDEPDKLHQLLDYCADATIYLAKDLYGLCDRYLGHTKYGRLFTNGMINMSEDISCMISGKLYQEFCAPATQKVIDTFGSGHMHCHSRAMYLVKEICSLRNVANLWLATDPNQPRPIDNIPMLLDYANYTCLAIDCDSFDEIEKNYADLIKGNFSICLPCNSIEEALDLTNRFNLLR